MPSPIFREHTIRKPLLELIPINLDQSLMQQDKKPVSPIKKLVLCNINIFISALLMYVTFQANQLKLKIQRNDNKIKQQTSFSRILESRNYTSDDDGFEDDKRIKSELLN